MKSLIFVSFLIAPFIASASVAPIPQTSALPIFLKQGFSSVLEFDEAPTRIVLGDSQAFQVERLEKSLVIRTLAAYATTNIFVYFKDAAPKLFVLSASEDAEPTYFKRIENPKPIPVVKPIQRTQLAPKKSAESRVLSAKFDPKKDYFTVELALVAESQAAMRPKWDLIRLRHKDKIIAPFKLWAERKEIQKDSSIKTRLIFAKPNIPRDLIDAIIVVPIDGQSVPVTLKLRRGI